MTPDEVIHAQLDVLMEGIAELVAERDALRKQAIAMEAEIESLTDERAGIRADRDSFRAERDRLSQEWGKAQEQVRVLRDALEFIEPLYDDHQSSGDLAMRLYETTCMARRAITNSENLVFPKSPSGTSTALEATKEGK
jgi:predicted nuclease with TOPRIM domain